MKCFYFVSPFDDAHISEFSALINWLLESNVDDVEKEERILYFNSDGGSMHYLDVLLDTVNNVMMHKDKLTLIPVGRNSSAAFQFIMLADCKKRIINARTSGLAHKIGLSVQSSELSDHTSFDYYDTEEVKKNNDRLYNYYKIIGFTKLQLDLFKTGGDVFVSYKQIIKGWKLQDAYCKKMKIKNYFETFKFGE